MNLRPISYLIAAMHAVLRSSEPFLSHGAPQMLISLLLISCVPCQSQPCERTPSSADVKGWTRARAESMSVMVLGLWKCLEEGSGKELVDSGWIVLKTENQGDRFRCVFVYVCIYINTYMYSNMYEYVCICNFYVKPVHGIQASCLMWM